MALSKLWVIAYRDLGRHRRRTFFTLLAVALGLALLIVLNGFIAGMVDDSLQNNIRLNSGHVQVRAATYAEEKRSLQWQDLLPDPGAVAAQAQALPTVEAAAPVLWASGIVNTADDAVNLQVYGIDTNSALYAPIQQAIVDGSFLAPDDRSGLLLGKRLADSLGLHVGDNVSLTVIDADGQPQEEIFTLRGLFNTGVVNYDDGSVFLPLSKAQAITNTAGRASAVVVLLRQADAAPMVAAELQQPGMQTFTWRDLNALFLQTMASAQGTYAIMDLIVLLIVAVIIANTLLMAVFERVREMGVLAALGMKGRQILLMVLLEALVLAVIGIILGIALGSAVVGYLSVHGISFSPEVASSSTIALSTTMYAHFVPGTVAALSVATLIIVLLASLYPAWFAARLEPVKALHAV